MVAKPAADPTKRYSRKALTGLNDDEIELWLTDRRIPDEDQLPDRFFSNDRGAFDRGHIVRREDVCFGSTYDQIVRANGDTFHTTNCSPQVAKYNQSNKGVSNWGDLENFILAQAKSEKYCPFGGPVLDPTDRAFRGVDNQGAMRVKVPRRFWKVVVARKDGNLEAFAFLLEQDIDAVRFESLLNEIELNRRQPVEFLPDSEWKRKMISIANLEVQLEGLVRFPQVVRDADQFSTPDGQELQRLVRLERFVPTPQR